MSLSKRASQQRKKKRGIEQFFEAHPPPPPRCRLRATTTVPTSTRRATPSVPASTTMMDVDESNVPSEDLSAKKRRLSYSSTGGKQRAPKPFVLRPVKPKPELFINPKRSTVTPHQGMVFASQLINRQTVLTKGDAASAEEPVILPTSTSNIAPEPSLFPTNFHSGAFVGRRSDLDHLSRLSDELMLYIFRFLDTAEICRCAQVSKNWRRLAYDDSFWKTLEVFGQTLTPDVYFSILRRNPRLFRISDCKVEYPDQQVVDIAAVARNALYNRPVMRTRCLNVNTAQLSDEVFIQTLKFCPNLEQLNAGCTLLSADAIKMITTLCPNLQRLNLNMIASVDADLVKFLCSHLKKLTHLSLGWTALTYESIRNLAENAPQLQHIDLSGGREIEDNCVEILTSHCRDLQSIDLSDCYKLSDQTIKHLTNCKSLKTISLSRCHNITICAMRGLAQKPGLVAINLFGCYKNVMPHIREVSGDVRINENRFSTLHVAESLAS